MIVVSWLWTGLCCTCIRTRVLAFATGFHDVCHGILWCPRGFREPHGTYSVYLGTFTLCAHYFHTRYLARLYISHNIFLSFICGYISMPASVSSYLIRFIPTYLLCAIHLAVIAALGPQAIRCLT